MEWNVEKWWGEWEGSSTEAEDEEWGEGEDGPAKQNGTTTGEGGAEEEEAGEYGGAGEEAGDEGNCKFSIGKSAQPKSSSEATEADEQSFFN